MIFATYPPIHRYLLLALQQSLGKQTLERRPEADPVMDHTDQVLQYDRVMTTKLAIAYALGLEVIYRTRREPLGGTALDLACGPGHFTLYMATHLKLDQVIGLDLSPGMVTTASDNADRNHMRNVCFRISDVTDLSGFAEGQFDLSVFTDAAHHMPNLAAAERVLREMDRVTAPDGLVMVMDLVRLRTARITESYVALVGSDYRQRGLDTFYDDFHNSMYAAWSAKELAGAVPQLTDRHWFQMVPRGLPAMQFLVGVPRTQTKLYLRRGRLGALQKSILPEFRAEWQALRQSMRWSKVLQLV